MNQALQKGSTTYADAQAGVVYNNHRLDSAHLKSAHVDQVTGLGNREAFIDHIKTQAERIDGIIDSALLILDLDHFRVVNHSIGVAGGDNLLASVARRIIAALTTSDKAFRIGGNEFAICIQAEATELRFKAVQQSALSIAEHLQQQLQMPHEIQSNKEDGVSYRGGASIGITAFAAGYENGLRALDEATIALKSGKRSGGGCIKLFRPHLNLNYDHRREMETLLRSAISNNDLEVHYQAQVDQNGHPVSAEALMRWTCPTLGPVSPGLFIPLAEEIGLINEVGKLAITKACEQLSEWAKKGWIFEDLTVAVNVSAMQIQEAGLDLIVQRALEKTGANPQKLTLEITESALLNNLLQAKRTLDKLSSLGVQISLDDFGTGYTSFDYLKTLPVNEIKIDRSFVRNVESSVYDKAITKMMLNLGEILDLSVVAEGFETQSQVDFLKSMGCKRFQGFLFAKPKNCRDFEQFVTDYSVLCECKKLG